MSDQKALIFFFFLQRWSIKINLKYERLYYEIIKWKYVNYNDGSILRSQELSNYMLLLMKNFKSWILLNSKNIDGERNQAITIFWVSK